MGGASSRSTRGEETSPRACALEEVSGSDSPQAVRSVVQQWMAQHPGCTVEIIDQADASGASDVAVDLLLRGLLQELTPFDLKPWDPPGVNKTLSTMRDKKVLFGVSAPALQERGITFMTPQLYAFREAAAEAGNETLANFLTQATNDPNVTTIFCKVFPPGSEINSSGWHRDQSNEIRQTLSRCLIYLTSGGGEGAQPLHYISFRCSGRTDLNVKIGFPRSLAVSGPLRCGTVSIGDATVEFEHRGEAPVGTACCFAMDVASIAQALDDYNQYVDTCSHEPSQIIIPSDLRTSCNYRIVDGDLLFMDSDVHAAWLRKTGMDEYWVRGGEVFKESHLNG